MQLNSSALNEEELNGGTSLTTLELTTASLNTSANSIIPLWQVGLRVGSLDFSRQLFQNALTVNQAVATFDFVLLSPEVSERITLGTADFGAVAANDISFARVNNLAEYAFDLAPQPLQPTLGTTLGVVAFDLAEEAISEIRTVALNVATLNFSGETSTPAEVVTLTNETLSFVALDITPSNAPLGEVVNLLSGSFDFVDYAIVGDNSITLSSPTLDFLADDIQQSAQNNLGNAVFDLVPQSLTVTQAAVQVLIDVATFNFTQGSLQLTGISSAGDRKRMLFGVGR